MAARISEPDYRSNDSHGYSGPGRDLPREPPRGPKALIDGPRGGGSYSRGRGFGGRGDARDRDYRDLRDAPGSGRGRERDWGPRDNFDNRERRPSPTGRNRSRSPTLRDPRDIDQSRMRRGSRDGPPSASSSISDVPPPAYRGRGGYRGRARGDWDRSRRGRGGFHEEREAFRPRSRSHDRAWDRNRDREPEGNRRDDDSRKDWDIRDRESDRSGRDQPPYRPESRNSTGTQISPLTPHPTSAASSYQLNAERFTHNSRAFSAESGRRASEAVGDSGSPTVPRDSERPDPVHSRLVRDRLGPGTVSPPPQAPQVPAFGSIAYRASSNDQGSAANRSHLTGDGQALPIPQIATKEMVPGPRPEAANNALMGPKVEQKLERSPTADSAKYDCRDFDNERADHGVSNATAATQNTATIDTQHQPSASLPTGQTREVPNVYTGRIVGFGSDIQTVAGPSAAQPTHVFSGKFSEGNGRQSSVTTAFKSNPQEAQSQASPARIPTGPRAERSGPPTRPAAAPPVRVSPLKPTNVPPRQPRNSNWKWVRPGLAQHTPRGPSIMNTVPTKRDFGGDDRSRTTPTDSEARGQEISEWPRNKLDMKAEQLNLNLKWGQNPNTDHARSDLNIRDDRPKSRHELKRDIEERLQGPNASAQPPETRKSPDSDDVGLEEGVMELDEADILEAEQKFEQQIQALELKRPATPRHHPILLQLLEECDALASAAEEMAKRTTDGPEVNPSLCPNPSGLPSPKLEELEESRVEEEPLFSLLPGKARRQTPPVESLPFLVSGLPTPFSELEDLQEELDQHEVIKARLAAEILNQRQRIDVDNHELKNEFAADYRRWRLELEAAENQNKSNATTTPEPNMPMLAASNQNLSTSTTGGRRTGKHATQFDLENAIQESLIAAEKDEERRNRERILQAKDIFNPEKEASVPDMLDRFERKARFFNDTNNLIDGELVFHTLGFIPQRDDFTPEEHEAFLDSYLSNPKKWGIIADALPGRNYQDCVLHYYHTKGQALYKEKERAFARIAKKGRKNTRAPQGRPKANALMPAFDGTLEYDTPQVPVTDTGRPKRAAAPTFGDTTDGEMIITAGTPARRYGTGNKADPNGDSSEKPSNKRTRTAPGKEKGAKRGKVPILAAAPGPSPQKNDKEMIRDQSKEPKLESEQRSEEIEGEQLLAGLHSSQTVNVTANQPVPTETWLAVQPASMNTPIPTQKQQQVILEQPHQQQQTRGSATTTSSYWSVPEQTDFQNLIHHFGTDWQAIANKMQTKTATMVYIFLSKSKMRSS